MSNSIFHRPSVALQPYVLSYLIIEDNTTTKFDNQCISIYPNGLNAIGFNYGAPTKYTDKEGTYHDLENGSFLVGTHEHTYKICPTPQQREFVVIFKPNVLPKILRTTMESVKNKVLRMDAVFKDEQEICEKLKFSFSDRDKVEIIESWLLKLLKSLELRPDLTSHIISDMHKNHGDVRIENICQHYKINRKYLERKFHESIGISPKQYADVVKLKTLFKMMATMQNGKWKDYYTDNGFTDYSHLRRYIQKMTGLSPKCIKEKLEHLTDYIITKDPNDTLRNVFILRDGNS